ncbi:MAG: hypothetical protein JWM82_3761, partial [Myxococcales bacterium]|nr:hypothetical protein [Myxococcales bacterium]
MAKPYRLLALAPFCLLVACAGSETGGRGGAGSTGAAGTTAAAGATGQAGATGSA